MQIFLRELGRFLIIFYRYIPKNRAICDHFQTLCKRLNGFWATDYSLFVQKKQSNPSYCALSHKVAGYNYEIFNKNRMGDYNLTGKFYHAAITGPGTLSQTVRCYVGGVYRFRCNGFSNSNNLVTMFVNVPEQTERSQTLLKADQDWQKDGYQTTRLGTNEYGGLYKGVNNAADDIRTGIAFWNNEYVNDLYFYVPQSAINGSGTMDDDHHQYVNVTFGFKIDNNFGNNYTNNYTAIDNVRIHYIGRSPFVLKEDAENAAAYTYNDTEVTTWNNEGTDTYVPIYLQRSFWENQWNPIVLPVDVEEDDLLAAFGADTKLADPYGLDDNDPYLIKFTQIPVSEGMIAGNFYLIKPSKLNYQKDVKMVNDSGDPYTIEGNSLALGKHPLFGQVKKNLETNNGVVTSSVFAPSDLWKEHNSIRLFGSYFPQETTGKAYVFGYDSSNEKVNLYHMINSQAINLKAFRFYIKDVDSNGEEYGSDAQTGEATSITFEQLLEGISMRDYENQPGVETGISDHLSPSSTCRGDGNIYDLAGRKVRTLNSQPLNVPKGIYVVNGKKMVVK